MSKNKTDQLLEKVLGRLERIEGKMATKVDLKRELSNYATKEDLRKELSNYATKNDLKKELKKMEDRMTKKFNFVVDHFDNENMEIKDRLKTVEKSSGIYAIS